jgi:hypothetical protein
LEALILIFDHKIGNARIQPSASAQDPRRVDVTPVTELARMWEDSKERMKKVLQFVALVLALCVSAQPVLAEGACAQQVCGNQRMMKCCHPAGGMQMAASAMQMPMGQSETGRTAVVPRQCSEDSCYAASAEIVPTIPATSASGVVGDGASVVWAAWLTPRFWATAKRLPGVQVRSPTARYILFRDFRI